MVGVPAAVAGGVALTGYKLCSLARRDGWDEALLSYMRRAAERCGDYGLSYGINDCCTLIAGACEAMTGRDPMAEYRGQYNTALSSARALRRIGGGDLRHVLQAKFDRIKPGGGIDGDIVLSAEGCAGIWLLSKCWFIDEETELLGSRHLRRNDTILAVAHG